MKSKGVYFMLGLVISLLLLGTTDTHSLFMSRGSASMDGPRLMSPTTEDIDLSGKDNLEFRWQRPGPQFLNYLEFKVYKGYQTIDTTLLVKNNYPGNQYPIYVPSSTFEAGQVYSWTMRYVLSTGQKSRRTSATFTVVKK